MRFCSQSFVLAVLLVQPVLAQDRPDFSGEWVRVEPTGSPAILTVVETADSLIVKNESAAGPLSVTVPLRGARPGFGPGRVAVDIGSGAMTSGHIVSVWRGMALVIEETRSFRKGVGDVRPTRRRSVIRE